MTRTTIAAVLLGTALSSTARTADAQSLAPAQLPAPFEGTHTCDERSCRSCTTGSCTTSCSTCRSCGSSCSSCRGGGLSSRDTCGDQRPSATFGVIGLRGSVTHVATSRRTESVLGAAIAGSADVHALDGAARTQMQWAIGGGEGGFDGLLAGALDLGYRLDVTDRQGPFARVGFDGRIQGNDALKLTIVELPRLVLGWQYIDGRTVLEGGLRGGTILTGRYKPGDEGSRRLNGPFEYGAFVALQIDIVKLEATAMRMDGRKSGDGSPIDFARGSVCGTFGKLGICGDAMTIRGDVVPPAPTEPSRRATSAYAGLSIGLAF